MKIYRKTFAVHNTLITYEIWERHQTLGWKKLFGTGTPPALFDVQGGVADVYYQNVFGTFRTVLEAAHKEDPLLFTRMMNQYEAQLESIQILVAAGKPFSDIQALIAFTKQFEEAWIGLDVSYMPDYVALDTASERRSAAIREQAFGFYIGADRLIRLTLQKLLPKLSEFVNYVTLKEVTTGNIPKQSILEARARHFIYYRGEATTDSSFKDFCHRASIRIESVYAPLQKEIHGFVGAPGKIRGTACLYTTDTLKESLHKNTILLAHDFLPRDLPLIKQASALVLDAGDSYGFATITARSLKKPCVFGTKIATMVLQTGDRIEVDGEKGLVQMITPFNAPKD